MGKISSFTFRLVWTARVDSHLARPGHVCCSLALWPVRCAAHGTKKRFDRPTDKLLALFFAGFQGETRARCMLLNMTIKFHTISCFIISCSSLVLDGFLCKNVLKCTWNILALCIDCCRFFAARWDTRKRMHLARISPVLHKPCLHWLIEETLKRKK